MFKTGCLKIETGKMMSFVGIEIFHNAERKQVFTVATKSDALKKVLDILTEVNNSTIMRMNMYTDSGEIVYQDLDEVMRYIQYQIIID